MKTLVPFFFAVFATSGWAAPVFDDAGNEVLLERIPGRIVSLAPHITEMLFELGVGERIVATVDHSDFPEAAQKIPRLGSAFSVSVESVVALDPDIVFVWQTGGSQKSVQQIRALGYPVYVNEAPTLGAIADSLQRMGRLVGEHQRGDELAAEFRQGLIEIGSSVPKVRRLVFFQIADAQLYTVNHEHLIGQALALCHADNVFGTLPMTVPIVSYESVVAANPEVVVVSVPFAEYVSPWDRRWASLGWENRIRRIDASLITRPGFRMLEGMKNLCHEVNKPGIDT
ncbi:MAG: ABC transporter substrate-binding protein [Pseudomonadales bacterium]|nr:ABC transporter substrate-binding protein [Pseudomonadales bacterium]